MRQLSEIQADIDMMDQAIQNAGMGVDVSTWQSEKDKYEKEYAEAKTYWEAQERVQAQTEKVESITLPLDFNDLLENPLANEMIIEVVKQFQLQAYEEHNAEVSRINAGWIDKVNFSNKIRNVLEDDIKDLQRRLDAENEQAKIDATEFASLEQQYSQALNDKKDAESKRDNAINELEQAKAEINRLNSHVFELQQQIASAPAPRAAVDITPNDRLSDLAKQAKESIVEKANRGLARWNLPALEMPSTPEPLATPEIPATQEDHPKDEVHTSDSGADTGTTGNEPMEQMVAETAAEETPVTVQSLKAELDALKSAHGARLDNIERIANIQDVA